MKNRLLILFSVLIMFFGAGCATARTKQYNAAIKGIYQVNQSLKVGRVDLAKKYSDELVRLVPPPKKIDVVKAIETKNVDGSTNKFVVLPQEFSGTPVLSIGTKPFNDIVAANPDIQKQLVQEEKQTEAFTKEVDGVIRGINEEARKQEKKSWLSSILGWTGIFGVGGLVGVILICVFFPAAIPLVMGLFRALVGWGNGLLTWMSSVFKRK